ncbi:MAG: hypothetical protein QGF20_09365, partial [Alphaproteobacteria bacterium]|nr:hypothetical protein [Alphaproteobacteria bacterium]
MDVQDTTSSEGSGIGDWLVKRGLAGDSIQQLIMGLCQRLSADGLPLLRAFVGLQTLHPLYGGFGYVWRRGADRLTTDTFGRQTGQNEDLLASPFHHMRVNNLPRLRQNLEGPAEPEFPI